MHTLQRHTYTHLFTLILQLVYFCLFKGIERIKGTETHDEATDRDFTFIKAAELQIDAKTSGSCLTLF